MGFAEAADVPVVLVGDIDRGGVIASLVGSHAVLPPSERARIKGFIINKLRGDAALFADGVRTIVGRTGWPCLGVVPWFEAARALPAEDVLALVDPPVAGHSETLGRRLRGDEREGEATGEKGSVTIAVPVLPRIANFDDFDPLAMEESVRLVMVRPGEAIPGDADLVLIPGSKATIADLAFVRAQGWDIDIAAHVRRGGRVLGLCGGYQMLGRSIADPEGLEGHPQSVAGLGLLEVTTVFGGNKATVAVTGRHVASGEPVSGYEIHLGRTSGPDCARPFVDLGGRMDGATSPDGRVAGTYVHGLFASDGFRRAYLSALGASPSSLTYEAAVEAALDGLADHLEAHVDIAALLAIAGYRDSVSSSAEGTATTTQRIAQAPR
jgi:adenosylcobyric acid synthase